MQDAEFEIVLETERKKTEAAKKASDEAKARNKEALEQRKNDIKEFNDEMRSLDMQVYKSQADIKKAEDDKEIARLEEKENKLQEIKIKSIEQLRWEALTVEQREKETRQQNIREAQAEWKQKLDAAKIYTDGAMEALDIVSNFQQAKMNKELAEAEGNQAKQDAIRKKYAKKEQALAIGKASINGALAVGNALVSTPFPLPALVFAALAAAKTASEIAVIKSVKYAKGGTWVEGGKLHSQGGNKYGDKELEQGEAVGVLSRAATRKYGKDFVNVVDMFNSGAPELSMPDINVQPANFSEFNKLVQINRMLLNEQKALNGYFKTQLKQIAPNVFIDGQGNKMVRV
jgi:hypothetical protein